MGKIRQLPDEVINQIAAGEVVERPASVVKELVENSLDAGATRIEIFIEQGGKKIIRVMDNGTGMNKDDLQHCVKRHWTSKISSSDDILKLTSLGFRGEALSSIAAVSKFEIRSRQQNEDFGWRLQMRLEDQRELKKVGMPIGTEVVVADLFFNLPARKNFLRRDQTEFAHILELIYQFALVQSKVEFLLHHNHKKRFHALKNRRDEQVISSILGEELAKKMIKVSATHPQIKVSGWIGQPGTGVSARPKQYVFVNKRPVGNRIIWGAVNQGYSSFLGRQEKAQFIIKLDVSSHLLDVNVHPQKKEVKFVSSDLVFRLVQQAVTQALTNYAIPTRAQTEGTSLSKLYGQKHLKPTPSTLPYYSSKQRFPENMLLADKPLVVEETFVPRKVFQVLSLFLIEEVEDTIMIYDQHAVHERILYGKFAQSFMNEKNKLEIQPLLIPTSIQLTLRELTIFQGNVETLNKLGFTFKVEDKKQSLQVLQIPSVLSKTALPQLFREFLDDLINSVECGQSQIKEIDNQTHQRLTYLACRSAIKAGDHLDQKEIEAMLQEFKQTKTSMTCPHGRPVMVKIGRREIEKWFRR